MQKNDLELVLHGDLSCISHEALISPDLQNIKIIVLPSHIKTMFNSYLNRNIDAEGLKKWAEFLCFRDEYVCKNWEDDSSADYYEDMWHSLQMTSTPEIDGEITPETIRRYLDILNKYSD